jgi:hypothetical protein
MGELVQIIPKTLFGFDGRSNSQQDITLALSVPTAEWVSAVLLVRLHFKLNWSGTASAAVVLQDIQIPPEDPSVFFQTGSPDRQTLSIPNGATAGTLVWTAFSNSPGSNLRVVLRWLQGATAASGVQNIAIGVDLVGRDH